MVRAVTYRIDHHHDASHSDAHTSSQYRSDPYLNSFHPDYYHSTHDHSGKDYHRSEQQERNYDRIGHGSPDMGYPNIVRTL